MPRPKKKTLIDEQIEILRKDNEELKQRNSELLEDNKDLAHFLENLREFNRDIVKDNLEMAEKIQDLEKEVELLSNDKKARLIQRLCILAVLLLWFGLMLLGFAN